MPITHSFDVVIIGAGHAGLEAALASARLGCRTALITLNLEQLVNISCNPSIGGLGKSHLVAEIDALGGEQAKLADLSSIQYKILNRSKGMAVWALRSQIDKYLYARHARRAAEGQEGLKLFQDSVADLLMEDGRLIGLRTERGVVFTCKAAVFCTGTFLRGKITIGEYTHSGGRIGELSCDTLSESLRKTGLRLRRLKTGTPARVHRQSLDFSKMEREEGDEEPLRFHWKEGLNRNPRVPCWLTWTHEGTHRIIRENRHRSPLYSGKIEGIGPRYCPSIEDKVFRFAEKARHQLYLEPEGLDVEAYYVNGCSSSMPEELQWEFMKTVPGMEGVEILKPAYAVEYDSIDSTQLTHALEYKNLPGLFFAGQVNGTSGYEEAAGQGLLAGINAARRARGLGDFTLPRATSYLGVMVDDLVLQGGDEPYRMFTARSEHRLSLRPDNADRRLTAIGRELGLVPDDQWAAFKAKEGRLERILPKLRSESMAPSDLERAFSVRTAESARYAYLFTRSDLDTAALAAVCARELDEREEDVRTLAADLKYHGYVENQRQVVERTRKREETAFPPAFAFEGIPGLKVEAVQNLTRVKPATLGQASRIPGVTPADIQILLHHLGKREG
ncbi:MAG: tRNA uridine-5-carboxymethylaminomethyl(34) synthesis enzyme MnmG [Spirochaetes bacterium]|nr:tRNA uridine-5-carboxymethylaminomethyl(34) synthesis enzyme MnmG [Spirochaetota bacterium]